MSLVGKVESLWRYPIKSMRGEELEEAFVGFSGVYGDRLYAFKSSAAPKGFPYLTGRDAAVSTRFRHADKTAKPPNLREAESMAPGITRFLPTQRISPSMSRRHREKCSGSMIPH